MADFKAVIAHTKLGRCVQKDVTGEQGNALLGKKIGDSIDGNLLGFEGYEFQLTGGSDKAGFPMRWDVQGMGKKRILIIEGVGARKIGKGVKQRKSVIGNTVGPHIIQVNLKITKEGKEALVTPPAKAEETAPAAEAAA